jgi:hypothetical protein
MSEQDKAYMGRKACGCVVALSTDARPAREVKATLKGWMREGLAVEITTVEKARPQMVWSCPHPSPPHGKDEIQAEVDRLVAAEADHE